MALLHGQTFVANALKFTEKGQVKIKAWAEYSEKAESGKQKAEAGGEPDETRVNRHAYACQAKVCCLALNEFQRALKLKPADP